MQRIVNSLIHENISPNILQRFVEDSVKASLNNLHTLNNVNKSRQENLYFLLGIEFIMVL